MAGYTYHLTHRCQERAFLLNNRRERGVYRQWLREAVSRHRVPVYGYCITRNHVHVVAHASDKEAVSHLMHLASGSFAKWYNVRGDRAGSVWEHPYHCTVIQNGQHLLNCLRYVDLNMVRAGVVAHPRDWPACGYDELTGQRKRYRILDIPHLVERIGMSSVEQFHAWYARSVDERLASEHLKREGHWTESLAVGTEAFAQRIRGEYRHRMQFSVNRASDGAWHVREEGVSYGTGEAQ